MTARTRTRALTASTALLLALTCSTAAAAVDNPSPTSTTTGTGTAPSPSPTGTVAAVFSDLYNPSPELVAAQSNLAALADQAQAAADRYQTALAAAARADQDAQTAAAARDAAQARAAEARAQLGQYAATAYMTGTASANLAAALSASSPADLVSRQNSLNAVASTRADLVRQVRTQEQAAAVAAAKAQDEQNAARRARDDAAQEADQAQAAATSARQQVAAMVASEAAAQNEAVVRAQAAAYSTTPGACVNADGVPVDFLPFGNGRIPPQVLTPLSGTAGQALWAPAAAAFEAMRAAAAGAGVTIGVSDSYRSYDRQVAIAAEKGLYSEGGLAAVPGTSNHGWGIALDLDLDAAAQTWMGQHAAAFGYVADVPGESWHWRFYVTAPVQAGS